MRSTPYTILHTARKGSAPLILTWCLTPSLILRGTCDLLHQTVQYSRCGYGVPFLFNRYINLLIRPFTVHPHPPPSSSLLQALFMSIGGVCADSLLSVLLTLSLKVGSPQFVLCLPSFRLFSFTSAVRPTLCFSPFRLRSRC